ncbi:MAG: DUF1743 domain-containing protein [Candidatus Heimdallarchaeota archaeon]|nr:DUF1743 domain-containing protein [Candidatus Heimdallarchaeota archaeon]
MHIYRIGLDSTDSPLGGCTTWTAVRLIELLQKHKVQLLVLPRLIRLNPNIPSKTRGNAAIAFIISTDLTIEELSRLCIPIIDADYKRYSIEDGKLPGFAIAGNNISSELYWRAVQHVVTLDEAIQLVNPLLIWPEGSNGLIGALAAISAELPDFTFEVIAYRDLSNCGSPRVLNLENLKSIVKKYPSTFSSVDGHRELIAPSGPDPVFCGIRGHNQQELYDFIQDLELSEPISYLQMFISNQATNAHVSKRNEVLHSYSCFSAPIVITSDPKIIQGGHTFLNARVHTTSIQLRFFEPTKELARKAQSLRKGDQIYIHGAVSDQTKIINVEYMEILDLVSHIEINPPICICSRRMTSAGFLAGYKCKTCNYKSFNSEKVRTRRSLFIGERVYASKSAQRHLTKPLERIHL